DFSLVLQLVDSFPLETGDSGIVRFSGFAARSNGGFYLADASQSQIFAFDNRGRQSAVLGRRGEGPGELLNPRFLSVAGDTLWVGQSEGRVSVFVRASFVTEFRLDSTSFLSSLVRTEDGHFVGTILPGTNGAVAWWRPDG